MFPTLRRLAPAAVVAAALSLASCAEPDPFEGIPEFDVDTPAVTVVEQGADPRELRYGDADNANEWATTVEVAGGLAQDVAEGEDYGREAPAGGDVAATTLPLTVTVSDADGERVVDLRAGAGRHSDLALGQDVAANEGFAMRWRAADTGAVRTVQLLPPAESPEPGRQAVEAALLNVMSTVVVFPEEPVGVGGSWSVTTRVTGDATMQRTTTYTVAAIDGDVVELEVEVGERASQSTLEGLRVEHTATTSDSRLTVDLARPLPTDGRIAATTRLVYAGNDSDIRIIQDVTSAVTYGKE